MSSWKTTVLEQSNTDYLNLFQFTDTHILPEEGEQFDGMDTFNSLVDVVTAARSDADWPPDGVLVTGDLVHRPVEAAYQRLKSRLESLEVPVFCIAGNHDEPRLMQEVLSSGNIMLPQALSSRDWSIILLNSYIPGTHSGRIDKKDLEQLERVLAGINKPVLICLHHQPVPVHSSWMDSMRLENPEELFAVLDRCEHVRCILWGHVHQEFEETRKGVSLLASPSTCVQFTPGTDRYVRDNRPPGYRRLRLYASGEFESGVCRIA